MRGLPHRSGASVPLAGVTPTVSVGEVRPSPSETLGVTTQAGRQRHYSGQPTIEGAPGELRIANVPAAGIMRA